MPQGGSVRCMQGLCSHHAVPHDISTARRITPIMSLPSFLNDNLYNRPKTGIRQKKNLNGNSFFFTRLSANGYWPACQAPAVKRSPVIPIPSWALASLIQYTIAPPQGYLVLRNVIFSFWKGGASWYLLRATALPVPCSLPSPRISFRRASS